MRVAAWNVEGRLSRFAEDGQRGSPEHIVAGIEKLDADVIALPEAFDAARPIEPHIRQKLESEYRVFEVPYSDRGDREYSATEDPHMMLLSRLEVENEELLSLVGGSRNMFSVDVIDPVTGEPVRVFVIHLDDRGKELRVLQVRSLAPRIAAAEPRSVIALGDFNAMHRESMAAQIFRSGGFRFLAEHVPGARRKDTLRRVAEMAIGDTLDEFELGTGLVDADRSYAPTATPKMRGQEHWPSIPMGQLDHIYTTPDFDISNFEVAGDGGSDHRAIMATIAITGQNS